MVAARLYRTGSTYQVVLEFPTDLEQHEEELPLSGEAPASAELVAMGRDRGTLPPSPP